MVRDAKPPGAILWQRNYWEHIVRTDAEMDQVRSYIRDNAMKWAADSLNP
jgi:putative transposase